MFLTITDDFHVAELGGLQGARACPYYSPCVRAFPALLRAGLNWENTMKKWKTPRIRMISVGCEINAYACADI
jgi:coenzyme PQQ precursor peptide PqqA